MNATDITAQLSAFGDTFLSPFEKLTSQVLSFLPQLLSALIVLIIGGILVRMVIHVLEKLLKASKIDTLFEKVGITSELKQVGIKTHFSDVLLKLSEIFLKLIVWLAVIDILNIDQLNAFVTKVTEYLPKVFIAVFILGIGVVVAKFTEKICNGAASSWGITSKSAHLFGRVAKISIMVFTIMVVLVELGIAEELIQTLFTGIVAALAIAGGIAFGLGGKEKAAEIVGKLSKR